MLKDAYLLAKIGADTAENEQKFAKNLIIFPSDAPLPAFMATSPKVSKSYTSGGASVLAARCTDSALCASADEKPAECT